MIQLCHFQWSSLKLAEVNLKHGSEIPIEAPRSLRGKQCLVVGGWWLVTWSLHGPKCVLPTLIILIILIQFDLVVWWGSQQKPTSDKPNINQAVWTGISQERPDEELCSLKVEGVSHRVAAPGIGVWMLGSVKDL